MAQRISEQVAEYLTLGGDGFTSQTSVPLHVQGHTILGDTTTNNNSDNYKANLTTINGHLIINASYNNHNNYSQGIRINKGSDNRALLMLGGDTGSTEGTNNMTWYIGTFPNSSNSSTTDLVIARNDYQFNNKKPSLQLNDNGLVVYKNLQLKSTMGSNTGFSLYGGNTTDSTHALYGSLLITTTGTTSATGVTRLQLGNTTASGSNNNARGLIRLYGSSTQYSDIYSSVNTNNKTLYLPNASGWLIVGGNGSNAGVGSSSQPIYISTSGVATAITGAIANNTTGNAATATTAGGITSPGTTAQFWRGNNSWSNVLAQTQDSTIDLSATNSKIGTAVRTLHIATAGSATGYYLNSGVVAGITFGSSDQARGGIYYQASSSYGSRLYFATTTSFTDGAYARMVIRYDGNVGIGVLDPDSLLHIKNGNLTVENGQLTIKGGTSSPASSTFNSSQLVLFDSRSDIVGLELQRQYEGSWQIINDNNTLKFKTGISSYNTDIITATSTRITANKPLEVQSQSNAKYIPTVSYSSCAYNGAANTVTPLTILLPENISPSNSYFITFMIDILQLGGLACYYITIGWDEGSFTNKKTYAYRISKTSSSGRPNLRTILFFKLTENNTNIQRLGICLGYNQTDQQLFEQLQFVRVRDVYIYKERNNNEINYDDYATDWIIYSSQPQNVPSHVGSISNNYPLGDANSIAGFPSLT